MDSVKEALHGMGFDMSKFHIESFGSARTTGGNGVQSLQLSGTRHNVVFSKTGVTVETDEKISLLSLAEAHGIEIDYSCRSGSCGACAVKCKGDIAENEECTIGKKEKESGYVYACCTVAKGDLEIYA
jgi:ferredoxin